MVASKKLHCAKCSKKCSGNVLKYQENYYHNNCLAEENQIKTNTSNTESADDNFKNKIVLSSLAQKLSNSIMGDSHPNSNDATRPASKSFILST